MPFIIPSAPKDPDPFKMLEHFRVRLTNTLRGTRITRTRTVTASTTLDAASSFIVVDTSTGDVTITLPNVQDFTNDTFVIKKKVAANTVHIVPGGTAQLDSGTGIDLTEVNTAVTVVSDGAAWWSEIPLDDDPVIEPDTSPDHDSGAVGDGATDDTAVVQGVLDQGGYVTFEPGVYRITAPLIVTRGITIAGLGSGPGGVTTLGLSPNRSVIFEKVFSGSLFRVQGLDGLVEDSVGFTLDNVILRQAFGTGTGAAGTAVEFIATSDTYKPSWMRLNNVTMEVGAGCDDWTGGVLLDGSLTSGPGPGSGARDVWMHNVRIVTGAHSSYGIRCDSAGNVFISETMVNFTAGTTGTIELLGTAGDANHATSNIFLSDVTCYRLALDNANGVYVTNSIMADTVTTTSNSVRLVVTGGRMVTAPTLNGVGHSIQTLVNTSPIWLNSDWTSVDLSQASAIATSSTTTRTFANRFRDLINVRDFGAVGDGVTDDRPGIQAAINLAQQHGGMVYLPSAPIRYVTASPLTMDVTKAPFTLQGDGKYSTILRYNGGVGTAWLAPIGGNAPLSITASDFTVQLNTPGVFGLNMSQSISSTLRSIRFESSTGSVNGFGIVANPTNANWTPFYNVLFDVTFDGVTRGIWLETNVANAPNRWRILGCTFLSVTEGIRLGTASLNLISGTDIDDCYFNENTGVGILVGPACDRTSINMVRQETSSGGTLFAVDPAANRTSIGYWQVHAGNIGNATIGVRGFEIGEWDSGVRWSGATSTDIASLVRTGDGGLAMGRRANVLTLSPTVSVDASQGDYAYLIVDNLSSFTVGQASNAVTGQQWTVTIFNNTLGAITTAWHANYHLAGAWVNPAPGKNRSITFAVAFNGLYEINRSAADVTT